MPITPLDILHREFRRGFRGYRDSEVQDFLRQISQDYEKSVTENARLKETTESLRQRLAQYERMEETMQNALVVAQKTAEETKRTAEKRAELILAEAEHQRKELLERARLEVAELETQETHLWQQRKRFELEFRALLETFQKMLDDPALPASLERSTVPPKLDEQEKPKPQEIDPIAEPSATPPLAGNENGNGNGNGEVSQDTAPRPRLIDWHLVGTHVDSNG